MRIWQEKQFDPDLRAKLAYELGLHPITARILIHRGVRTEEEARRFLNPSQDDLLDPFLLPDIVRAVDRMHAAVMNQERVVIYGDYDVDGMTAIALYYEWFDRHGCPVGYYIPSRVREGYGLNQKAIRNLVEQKTDLLITADCGTTSVEEIKLAQTLGLDVIVTDHHEVPIDSDDWPPAYALINPKRPDSQYPFHGLCTAGLAYKVIQALEMARGGLKGADSKTGHVPDASYGLDLVALGTLADVSPVTGENRYLVNEGLKQIEKGCRVGIGALKTVSKTENKPIGCGTVGFILAPRINAVGRLADPYDGVRLLTTRSREEANRIAARLEMWNRERQQIEQDILTDVERQITESVDLSKASCIVLSSKKWHLGVIGIVASRIVERYGRPTVLISLDDEGIGRGSARSIPCFHMQRGLAACANHLSRFGGHQQAAGFTIRQDQISLFRERFGNEVSASIGQEGYMASLMVDAVIDLTELNFPLIRELERLRPHGIGNPEPILAVREAFAVSPRIVGKNHLKFKVRKRGGLTFDAIGFRMGEHLEDFSHNRRWNLAFMPEVQEWQGEERIQLRIKDLQSAG